MKNIKDFLAENGYNLAQFYHEFKTHASYNSFTQMMNADNAATRLAAALISVIESVKVYQLDVVAVDAVVLLEFQKYHQIQVDILRGQYPDLRPHEISNIQLRVMKNNKAQLFFEVKGNVYKLDLLPYQWVLCR